MDKNTNVVKIVIKVISSIIGYAINVGIYIVVGYLYFVKFADVSPEIKILALMVFEFIYVSIINAITHTIKERRFAKNTTSE